MEPFAATAAIIGSSNESTRSQVKTGLLAASPEVERQIFSDSSW
jgi:hypothetical protein